MRIRRSRVSRAPAYPAMYPCHVSRTLPPRIVSRVFAYPAYPRIPRIRVSAYPAYPCHVSRTAATYPATYPTAQELPSCARRRGDLSS